MKLNEFQERWLAALESGEYTQGRNCLNRNGKLCCLGVACEIAGLEKRLLDNGRYRYIDKDGTGQDLCAPKSVSNKLRLFNANGLIVQPAGERRLGGALGHACLTSANDNGKTFAEIASFARSNPEKVFVDGEEQ